MFVYACLSIKKLARVLSGTACICIYAASMANTTVTVSIKEVTVLEAKSSYSYTIPSFTAITLRLRHLKIAIEEEAGPVLYDSFFNEEHGSFQVLPRQAIIRKGCFVDVSYFPFNYSLLYAQILLHSLERCN